MKNRRGFNNDDGTTDINISPLIDMVFILLIFFIVTTVFVEESGLAANTPDPNPNINTPDKDDYKVSFLVRKTGQVTFRDRDGVEQEIGPSDVYGIVSPEMQNEKYPITLKVEPDTTMHLVVQVIDACESAGAETISLKSVASEN